MTTQPLAEPPTVSYPESTSATGSKSEKHGTNGFVLWGFIIMLIGAAIGIIGKKLVHDDIVTVVGVLISLAGMFLTVYPYLAPSPRKKNDSGSSLQPEVLKQSQPGKYLPQERNVEYLPSITERTTDLLKNSAATGVRQKEDGLHKPERTVADVKDGGENGHDPE
jgi:hypothetical protein